MADLEAVVWGYGLLEGPRYDAATDSLYFSDVPNGGVYRLDVRGGGVEVAIPKRKGVGGIALHERGGLVVGGRNVCHVLDGQTRVLFQPASNGLNDLFADSAGNVVFGSLRDDPFAFGTERKAGEGWRITAEGEATELYGGVLLSNGIGLSPDGSVLYHADTASNGVWAHDYQVDGPVSGRRLQIHADDLQPDGLAIDEDGVVWVADVSGSRSVRAFDPARHRGGPHRRARQDGDQHLLRRGRPARRLHRHRRQHGRRRPRRHRVPHPGRRARDRHPQGRTSEPRSEPRRAAPAGGDFDRLARARRMTRDFLTDPVPAEVLDGLLDAARRAPSAGNTASLAFLVLDTPTDVVATGTPPWPRTSGPPSPGPACSTPPCWWCRACAPPPTSPATARPTRPAPAWATGSSAGRCPTGTSTGAWG